MEEAGCADGTRAGARWSGIAAVMATTLALWAGEPSYAEEAPAVEAPASPVATLGKVGSWSVPAPWSIQDQIGVELTSHQVRPPDPEAKKLDPDRDAGTSRFFTHPAGASATVLALPFSQALSLKRLATQMASPVSDCVLEAHADLRWWHATSAEGDQAVYTTGVGGKTIIVLVAKTSTLPAADLEALLAGLKVSRDPLHVDETWISFDMPSDVAYVHRDASPFSWTRGGGIVAVDVTFDKSPVDTWQSGEKGAPLAEAAPGWIVLTEPVVLDLKGMQAFNAAMAEVNSAQTGEPPKDAMKALIAAPGSRLNASAVSFQKKEGILRVELRAEGDDALLIAWNDLLPMARGLTIKPRYDWWYDARRMHHRVSRELAEDVLTDAAPALAALATLTNKGLEEGFGSVTGTGLTVAQTLPMVAFDLFEVGRARTPTEDTTITNLGYLPQAQYILQDYFDAEGDVVATNVHGVGAGITQNARFFRQRGEVAANWALFWPQEGTDLPGTVAPGWGVTEAKYLPFYAKLRGGYALDPTTYLLPHRFGAFGDWHLGIGIGTSVDMSQVKYKDPDGADQTIFMWNTAFAPTAGFHTRLFWGALQVSAQGYYVPSQLGLVNIFRDTAAISQLEADGAAGTVPDLRELFATSGASALMTYAMGSASFDGARGIWLTTVLGAPLGGNLHPPITWGLAKDAGRIPPLGAKLNRMNARNTIGLGVTVFYEEASYLPFSTPWNVAGEQTPVSTVNKGIIVGLGSGATYLPSFGSGRR